MYKFSWKKYCEGCQKAGVIPSALLAKLDGYTATESEYRSESVRLSSGTTTHYIDKRWCDYIPDAPSKFMVFDRETFATRWPDHENTEWAVQRYGRIMEFKGNSETALDADGFSINRNWCRPLTLDDFKRERIAVTFACEAEQKRFLQECEKAAICMHEHDKRVLPNLRFDARRQFSTSMNRGNFVSWLSPPGVYSGCVVVPFASFSFPSEPPKPIPSCSIHITSDGLTTRAMMKEGEAVVKRSEAKCNPTDAYSFRKGAETAFARLWDKPEAKQDVEYMEVKRKAKVGEKIKTKSGAIMTVTGMCDRGSDICVMCGSLHLLPYEYVVLVPVRSVHRKAKEGEWAEIKTDPSANQEFYPSGMIVKCKNSDDLFSHGWFMSEDKYDVLEGFEEGARWPER